MMSEINFYDELKYMMRVDANLTPDYEKGWNDAITHVIETWNNRANDWHKIENGLPKNAKQVQVTIKIGDNEPYTTQGFFDGVKWRDCYGDYFDHDDKIIAWKPLSEPYLPK